MAPLKMNTTSKQLKPVQSAPGSVDIFLTVYDRNDFLQESLEGALAQTWSNYNLTVLDDGGLSETAKFLSKYPQDEVRHHVNRTRLGIAGSLFGAIERSTSKYIAILNDDDYWHPSFLEHLVRPMEDYSEIALSFCDHWIVDSKSNIMHDETNCNSNQFYRSHLHEGNQHNLDQLVIEHNSVPMAMGCVVRRTAIDPAMLSRAVGRHYDIWLSMIASKGGAPGYYVPERLSYYRIHEGMESNSKAPSRFRDIAAIYSNALCFGIHPSYRMEFAKRWALAIASRIRAQLTT